MKGKQRPNHTKINDIRVHLDENLDFSRYSDYGKIRVLSKVLTRYRNEIGHSTAVRQSFLDRFYHDVQFNAVYREWLLHGKSQWWYPSLDHIMPTSRGGSNDLDNLQFITWFENRSKGNMTPSEWGDFKKETNMMADVFIESILERYNTKLSD